VRDHSVRIRTQLEVLEHPVEIVHDADVVAVDVDLGALGLDLQLDVPVVVDLAGCAAYP
jgi:hypothetical protein